MAWYLRCKNKRFRISGSCVLGRVHNVSDNQLSREHATVFSDLSGLYVKDLSSTNGVLVNGHRINAREKVKLKDSDAILIGNTPFVVQDSNRNRGQRLRILMGIDFIVFLFLTLLVLNSRGMDWGRSTGFEVTGLLIGCLFVGLLFSILLTRLLTQNFYWSLKSYFIYGLASIVLGSIAYYPIVNIFDQELSLSEKMITSRIEYYCMKKLDRDECVRLTNMCPGCALTIEKWKRNIMVENLKNWPASSRQPASVN